jgi:hypothetical protein
MLTAALIALTIAVLFGSWLAVLHFDGREPARVPWGIALVHAAIALGGFALLAVALRGPARGADQGTGGFGIAAAVLFALAIVVGLAIFLRFRVARKSASALVGVHATLAVSAIVILAAYVLSG